MAEQSHQIHRQLILLRLNDYDRSNAIQERAAKAFQELCLPVLGQIFTELAGPGFRLEIDSLEIDLGWLQAEEIEDAFLRHVPELLRLEMQKFQSIKIQNDEEGEYETPDEYARPGKNRSLELLKWFMRKGSLPPWQQERPADLIPATIRNLASNSPETLQELLWELRDISGAVARFDASAPWELKKGLANAGSVSAGMELIAENNPPSYQWQENEIETPNYNHAKKLVECWHKDEGPHQLINSGKSWWAWTRLSSVLPQNDLLWLANQFQDEEQWKGLKAIAQELSIDQQILPDGKSLAESHSFSAVRDWNEHFNWDFFSSELNESGAVSEIKDAFSAGLEDEEDIPHASSQAWIGDQLSLLRSGIPGKNTLLLLSRLVDSFTLKSPFPNPNRVLAAGSDVRETPPLESEEKNDNADSISGNYALLNSLGRIHDPIDSPEQNQLNIPSPGVPEMPLSRTSSPKYPEITSPEGQRRFLSILTTKGKSISGEDTLALLTVLLLLLDAENTWFPSQFSTQQVTMPSPINQNKRNLSGIKRTIQNSLPDLLKKLFRIKAIDPKSAMDSAFSQKEKAGQGTTIYPANRLKTEDQNPDSSKPVIQESEPLVESESIGSSDSVSKNKSSLESEVDHKEPDTKGTLTKSEAIEGDQITEGQPIEAGVVEEESLQNNDLQAKSHSDFSKRKAKVNTAKREEKAANKSHQPDKKKIETHQNLEEVSQKALEKMGKLLERKRKIVDSLANSIKTIPEKKALTILYLLVRLVHGKDRLPGDLPQQNNRISLQKLAAEKDALFDILRSHPLPPVLNSSSFNLFLQQSILLRSKSAHTNIAPVEPLMMKQKEPKLEKIYNETSPSSSISERIVSRVLDVLCSLPQKNSQILLDLVAQFFKNAIALKQQPESEEDSQDLKNTIQQSEVEKKNHALFLHQLFTGPIPSANKEQLLLLAMLVENMRKVFRAHNLKTPLKEASTPIASYPDAQAELTEDQPPSDVDAEPILPKTEKTPEIDSGFNSAKSQKLDGIDSQLDAPNTLVSAEVDSGLDGSESQKRLESAPVFSDAPIAPTDIKPATIEIPIPALDILEAAFGNFLSPAEMFDFLQTLTHSPQLPARMTIPQAEFKHLEMPAAPLLSPQMKRNRKQEVFRALESFLRENAGNLQDQVILQSKIDGWIRAKKPEESEMMALAVKRILYGSASPLVPKTELNPSKRVSQSKAHPKGKNVPAFPGTEPHLRKDGSENDAHHDSKSKAVHPTPAPPEARPTSAQISKQIKAMVQTFRQPKVAAEMRLVAADLEQLISSQNSPSSRPSDSKSSPKAEIPTELAKNLLDLIRELEETLPQKNTNTAPPRSSYPIVARLAKGESIPVENAGLVILSPFIPHFFDHLGLTEEGNFRDDEAQETAVDLLHLLAFGPNEEDRPLNVLDYLLPLNKILCGMPLDVSVEREFSPFPPEIAEAENLLKSVCTHWKAAGAISPNGLRRGFLQRRGLLSLSRNGYLLKVQHETPDILLEFLPWGFTPILHPFMQEFLTVDWKTQ